MLMIRWVLAFFIMVGSICHAEYFSNANIPVLDLADYENPKTRTRFVRQMKNALAEMGFFALQSFGVDEELLNEGYRALESFFYLPIEDKLRYNDLSVDGRRGYVPGESAKGEERVDFKEFFALGRERNGICLSAIENIWPSEVNLKKPLLALFDRIEERREILERAFSEALGVPEDFFSQMTKKGECMLRTLHYPVRPCPNLVWSAAHTDINLFAITPPASAKGLQYQTKEGDWMDVIAPKNCVIIHCGDMMENLTNGLFHSALHRVVDVGAQSDRFSMVFYTHPSNYDKMDPLPQCIAMTGGRARYPQATALELLEERLVELGLASYKMMEHLGKSGLMERLLILDRASPQAMDALARAGLATTPVREALKKSSQGPSEHGTNAK